MIQINKCMYIYQIWQPNAYFDSGIDKLSIN